MPQLVQRGSSLKEILEQTSRRSSLSRVEPENQKVVRDASLAAYDLTSEALEGLLQRSTSLSQALDLIGQHDRDGDCDYCHGQVKTPLLPTMLWSPLPTDCVSLLTEDLGSGRKPGTRLLRPTHVFAEGAEDDQNDDPHTRARRHFLQCL